MNKAFDKLKRAWDENPMQVLVVGALVATAAAKLIEASNSSRNSRSWQKEVDRRRFMTHK